MTDLLDLAVAAHGGFERFSQFSFVEAKLHQGGVLWALKGKPTVLEDCNVKVDLKREQVSHWPFAPTQNRSDFTPDRVAIEDDEGRVVEELLQPRKSFNGYEMETHWSNPQVAYFAGYTMWTYLTSPFILKRSGVVTREIAPWSENGRQWRRLLVQFPDEIATHSTEQTFYFDDKGLLVRHDYEVDIQGRNAAARYLSDYVTADGIVMPGKMRIYPRGADNRPLPEPLIVSIEVSDFRFS
ncbi:hypothetical protein [Rhizobium sp. CNPSo 4039]|uniref:hypothetical protein n=1 Tax=Rhizobium sp. CNPSo 4039 TaxID=3021409 RepID=UPI00255053DD|nr:hypothetical protein [Rhizobium sp. CNPSo 4039]MDK4717310.1 hypothetical protein [Rhizobium sp. CNPSo 4039]